MPGPIPGPMPEPAHKTEYRRIKKTKSDHRKRTPGLVPCCVSPVSSYAQDSKKNEIFSACPVARRQLQDVSQDTSKDARPAQFQAGTVQLFRCTNPLERCWRSSGTVSRFGLLQRLSRPQGWGAGSMANNYEGVTLFTPVTRL